MNIYKREMRANLKSIIIWSIGMALLIAGGMGKFANTESASAEMMELIGSIPQSLKVIFGFGSFDFSKAIGFYGVMYLYVVIMGAVHAAMLGAGIISKEERDKTTEFLLVKPIERSKIITEKLLAGVTNVLILNIVTFVASYYMVNIFMHDEKLFGQIGMLMLGLFIIQLIFLTIGMAFAAINKNSKKAPVFATYIILIAFVINVIVQINESLGFLAFLTPFQYFTADMILNKGTFNIGYIVLSAILIVAMVIVTYKKYEKRDLMV